MKLIFNSLVLGFAMASGAAEAAPAVHCTPVATPQPATTHEQIVKMLDQSQAGKFALDHARKAGAQICLYTEYDGRAGYYLDNKLMLRMPAPLEKIAKTAAHELRHKMQMDQGFSANTDQTPRAKVLAGKVMEADAEAFANLVVYQLEKKGYDFSSFFEKKNAFSGVRDAFLQAVTAEDGEEKKATRAAFDAWFRLDIAKFYEETYLDSYSRYLDETPYHHALAYGHQRADKQQIESLGLVSADGGRNSNYLVTTGGFDAENPSYAGMLTPENQVLLETVEKKIRQKREGLFTP